jgi:hypothetical protein
LILKKRLLITRICCLVALALYLATSCATQPSQTTGSSAPPASSAPTTAESTTAQPGPLSLTFDFGSGDLGWTAGFADLPVDYEPSIYALHSGIRSLPPEIGRSGSGFMLSGSNRSDDLFMFVKKKLSAADGILPGQTYQVNFRIELASDALAGGIGAGGAPGESVYVKAGAASVEPLVLPALQDGENMLLMNIDKGQQSQEGPNALVIGNLAKTDGSEDDSFALKQLDSAGRDFTVQSNAAGDLWLLVGTDSAYEGITTLYLTRIEVTLTP